MNSHNWKAHYKKTKQKNKEDREKAKLHFFSLCVNEMLPLSSRVRRGWA